MALAEIPLAALAEPATHTSVTANIERIPLFIVVVSRIEGKREGFACDRATKLHFHLPKSTHPRQQV
jgi:hypothetical protein